MSWVDRLVDTIIAIDDRTPALPSVPAPITALAKSLLLVATIPIATVWLLDVSSIPSVPYWAAVVSMLLMLLVGPDGGVWE